MFGRYYTRLTRSGGGFRIEVMALDDVVAHSGEFEMRLRKDVFLGRDSRTVWIQSQSWNEEFIEGVLMRDGERAWCRCDCYATLVTVLQEKFGV